MSRVCFILTKTGSLIKHTEQPERNPVAESRFDFIGSDKAILQVFDLMITFIFPSNLKSIFVIHDEIAFFAAIDLMQDF